MYRWHIPQCGRDESVKTDGVSSRMLAASAMNNNLLFIADAASILDETPSVFTLSSRPNNGP